jgi:hypothetical protein
VLIVPPDRHSVFVGGFGLFAVGMDASFDGASGTKRQMIEDVFYVKNENSNHGPISNRDFIIALAQDSRFLARSKPEEAIFLVGYILSELFGSVRTSQSWH